MMALDNRRFNIVEDKSFCELVNHMEPRFVLLSRRFFFLDVCLAAKSGAITTLLHTPTEGNKNISNSNGNIRWETDYCIPSGEQCNYSNPPLWFRSDAALHQRVITVIPLSEPFSLSLCPSPGASWRSWHPRPRPTLSWRGGTAPPPAGPRGWWWPCLKVKGGRGHALTPAPRQTQHQQSLRLNMDSPITSLLSKLSSLTWLAFRICILMNSILVLLSWSICCAVANSFRSCEQKRNTVHEVDLNQIRSLCNQPQSRHCELWYLECTPPAGTRCFAIVSIWNKPPGCQFVPLIGATGNEWPHGKPDSSKKKVEAECCNQWPTNKCKQMRAYTHTLARTRASELHPPTV